jgi:hypothetical protein
MTLEPHHSAPARLLPSVLEVVRDPSAITSRFRAARTRAGAIEIVLQSFSETINELHQKVICLAVPLHRLEAVDASLKQLIKQELCAASPPEQPLGSSKEALLLAMDELFAQRGDFIRRNFSGPCAEMQVVISNLLEAIDCGNLCKIFTEGNNRIHHFLKRPAVASLTRSSNTRIDIAKSGTTDLIIGEIQALRHLLFQVHQQHAETSPRDALRGIAQYESTFSAILHGGKELIELIKTEVTSSTMPVEWIAARAAILSRGTEVSSAAVPLYRAILGLQPDIDGGQLYAGLYDAVIRPLDDQGWIATRVAVTRDAILTPQFFTILETLRAQQMTQGDCSGSDKSNRPAS